MNFRTLALLTILPSIALPHAASQTEAPALAASAPAAVPPLVPYSGQVEGWTGQTSATFLVYKDQAGGEPLFAESQMISFDKAGRYKVQLGAANPNGLPPDLFSSGEARWLEVQIAGQPAEPRVLLASVPYALKAADAATLGGLPASAFALAGSNTAIVGETPAATPNTASTVTTTGGAANKVAKFSGANTIVNSILYDNGAEVGIGTMSPTATLTVDGTLAVDGTTTFKGSAVLGATGTAISSHSYNSEPLQVYASAYNSSSKKAVQPLFEWQGEPAGNNTAAPTGTLNLLSSTTTANAAETGFYFNSNGTIHFAPGQTFGARSSSGVALDGISTSSYGVEGSSSTGAGVYGTSVQSAGVEGTSTFNLGVYGASDHNIGVYGSSNYTTGVYGLSLSTQERDAGVEGFNMYGAGLGVLGNAGLDPSSTWSSLRGYGIGAGVSGDTPVSYADNLTIGVMGTADNNYAGLFQNNSAGSPALLVTNSTNNQGVLTAIISGNYGGCNFDTSGDLTCNGTKSAVVPVDNNTRKVALYAVESPENWFEDFGSGQLSTGAATIELEPTFAQTVNVGIDYHVFLTPNGDSKGLYISSKTSTSFEVRESGSGSSNITFDYRIVARRKGYETVRLADKTKEQDLSRPLLMRAAQRAKQMKQ